MNGYEIELTESEFPARLVSLLTEHLQRSVDLLALGGQERIIAPQAVDVAKNGGVPAVPCFPESNASCLLEDY